MAKVKILKDIEGASDSTGATTKVYRANEIIDDKDEWSQKMGRNFVELGVAMYVQGNQEVEHTLSAEDEVVVKKTKPKPKPKVKQKKEYRTEPSLKKRTYRKKK